PTRSVWYSRKRWLDMYDIRSLPDTASQNPLGALRVAHALDALTVIENDGAAVLQAGPVVVLLHQVVVELLHILDHDGLIGHVEGDFLQEKDLALIGHRDPGMPNEKGGRVGQGVVGEHRDHTGLRVRERDAAG